MTPTPVGMRCPECARQRTKVRTAQTLRGGSGQGAPVTKAIIVVCVLAYLAEISTGSGGLNGAGSGAVSDWGALLGKGIFVLNGVPHLGGVAEGEWWRLITSGFLHASVFHILFNMYLLWILGQMLEPAIGSLRFGAVYFASLLAGSFGALLLEPRGFTVGASGAIFGLMGFAYVDLRARGIDPFRAGIGWLIVINLGLGFVLNNVSVGGHVGGLVGGALAGFAFQWADKQRQPALGLVACAAIALAGAVAGIAVAGATGLGTPHL
jgi:membrane associated rhomboid family serine protease